MKKALLLTGVSMLLMLSNVHAQKMDEKTNFLSLGIGPAANYWTTYHSGGTPALRLAFDHGVKKQGPGIITLGGALGYFYKYYDGHYYYNHSSYNYKWSWNYISVVFRAGYNYNMEDAGVSNLNVYGGLGAGLLFSSYHDTYSGPGYVPYDNANTDFIFNLYVGANYFISQKMAIYLEFGYDISYATLGVTFNLN